MSIMSLRGRGAPGDSRGDFTRAHCEYDATVLGYELTLALAFPPLVLPRPCLLTTSKTTVTSSTAKRKIMQPEREDLLPPKDDPFTQEELKAYDGTDANKPIYVAIKGASSSSFPSSSVYLSRSNAFRTGVQERCSTCRESAIRMGPAGPTRSSRARTARARLGCRASSLRMPCRTGARSRRRTARRSTTGTLSSRAFFYPLPSLYLLVGH